MLPWSYIGCFGAEAARSPTSPSYVVRFKPSLAAAPFGPPITQPTDSSMLRIRVRSESLKVITETTGHAESVEVIYDPSRLTYSQLLRIFFSVAHDPTQLNWQGPDASTSYRSAIFYVNDEQKRIATAYIAQLDAAKVFPGRIVTELTPLKGFYRGEDYHQDYALKNPGDSYIQICDLPKIEALRQQFPELFFDYKGKRQ